MISEHFSNKLIHFTIVLIMILLPLEVSKVVTLMWLLLHMRMAALGARTMAMSQWPDSWLSHWMWSDSSGPIQWVRVMSNPLDGTRLMSPVQSGGQSRVWSHWMGSDSRLSHWMGSDSWQSQWTGPNSPLWLTNWDQTHDADPLSGSKLVTLPLNEIRIMSLVQFSASTFKWVFVSTAVILVYSQLQLKGLSGAAQSWFSRLCAACAHSPQLWNRLDNVLLSSLLWLVPLTSISFSQPIKTSIIIKAELLMLLLLLRTCNILFKTHYASIVLLHLHSFFLAVINESNLIKYSYNWSIKLK